MINRIVIAAAALVLGACTAQPAAAPSTPAAPSSTGSETAAETSSSDAPPADSEDTGSTDGESADTGTSTDLPKASEAGLSCAKAPQGVVSETLGLTLAAPKETINENVVVCQYTGGPVLTTVRFQIGTDAARFAQGKSRLAEHGQTAVDVPGFQDEAYSSSRRSGSVDQNTVVARKGTVEILVTAPAGHDAQRKLIAGLFTRL